MKTYGVTSIQILITCEVRVCAMTTEEVIAKSFKVKNWMTMNPIMIGCNKQAKALS